MKGTVITAEEVKARWGYGEINSERFGGKYQAQLPSALFDAGKRGDPFSTIPQSDWRTLIAALKVARDPGFIDNVDTYGAPTYTCAEWRPFDLLGCKTLPCFRQFLYGVFLAHPVNRDQGGRPDDADPRYKSQNIPFDPNFKLEEPLIAIMVNGAPMLLEGYLRSILWLRNPQYPLRVWVPTP